MLWGVSSSRVHGAPIMHAPQEKIVLEDCPLLSLQRGHGRAERAPDGGPWSRTVKLPMLRRDPDALGHGGVSHNASVSAIMGASASCTGIRTTVTFFPMQALRLARRTLGAGLLHLRFHGAP